MATSYIAGGQLGWRRSVVFDHLVVVAALVRQGEPALGIAYDAPVIFVDCVEQLPGRQLGDLFIGRKDAHKSPS